jgi:hypothetical protein
MSKEKDSFPYFEPDNYHGWFIQFKSHCRGIGAHLALKPRPTHPIDANGNPQVLNAAQTRALAKLQETWDEHDHKAFSALMKACIRDDKTKKLTETEDFEHALPLLTRLEERYLSDAERQKGVAWSQFFNFTAQSTESAMDLVSRFDGIVRQLENLGEPVTPAQLYHRFLEASLQSKGTHHQLLATAIYSNPAPLTYDQMKVRFEKSALQHAPGAAAPPARDAAEVNYVGAGGTSSSSSSNSHGRHDQKFPKEKKYPPRHDSGEGCAICGVKGHVAKRCHLRAKVDELVQRHKRDVNKDRGGRKPKKTKARHGYEFSRDTLGHAGRPPRSTSPARNKQDVLEVEQALSGHENPSATEADDLPVVTHKEHQRINSRPVQRPVQQIFTYHCGIHQRLQGWQEGHTCPQN